MWGVEEKMRIGINGFGRIGRTLLRSIFDRSIGQKSLLSVVRINDSSSTKTLAHLLKFDSTHGRWQQDVSYDEEHLVVNHNRISVSHTRDPLDLPWDDAVDVAIDCTGAFKQKQDLQKYLRGSVKKVLISAPAEGADLTVCYGINHREYDPTRHHLVSNASCTTNCLAPLAKVLDDSFGIISGFMTTVHSYTNDQRLLDGRHKDFRRSRAASLSMIPTTTGAAQSLGKILPGLQGKIDGISVRVPTPNVSLVDFVVHLKSKASVKDVNEAFIHASKGTLKGVLATEDLPLVSCDFLGHPASAIVDLPSTMVLSSGLVKVLGLV